MNLRKFLAPLVLVMVAAACASTGKTSGNSYMDKAPEQLSEPDIRIWQVGNTPFVARHETGPSSVRLGIRILNTSSEPITIDRVQIQSMGMGAYTIPSSTQPVGKTIAPNSVVEHEFWVPVQVEDTITGANGPVSVRGIAYFTAQSGRFRQIVLQNLNDQMGTPNPN